jgi:hypothetical protein
VAATPAGDRMKIFIGSSKESIEVLREVEIWLQEHNHEPLPWDQPGLFPPGEQTFLTLINISKVVDGAICIFGEDDRVWYRGDAAAQPRDNVLIEYGLFVGALGPRKAIICKHGKPKDPDNLLGITAIDLSKEQRARGRQELRIWANRLSTAPIDPGHLKLMGRIHELEDEKERLEQNILFEKEKSSDLEKLLQAGHTVDFSKFDLERDGHWKLLFRVPYFEDGSKLLAQSAIIPSALRKILEDAGSGDVAAKLAWHQPPNSQRTIYLARKALRVFRQYYDSEKFMQFIRNVPEPLHQQFIDLANIVLSQLPPEADTTS